MKELVLLKKSMQPPVLFRIATKAIQNYKLRRNFTIFKQMPASRELKGIYSAELGFIVFMYDFNY